MTRPHLASVIALLLVTTASTGCKRSREKDAGDSHLKQAVALLGTDPDRAITELNLVTKAPPGQVAFLRAQAYERKGDFSLAADDYRTANEALPNDGQILTALGRVELIEEQVNQARLHLADAVRKEPTNLEAILLYSVSAQTPEQMKEALAALRAWPQLRPAPSAGRQQLPLPAEYFIALAELEDHETKAAEARSMVQRGQLGSQQDALVLVQFAIRLEQLGMARRLIRHLAKANLAPEQLISVASWSLQLEDTTSAEIALKRVPRTFQAASVGLLRASSAVMQGHDHQSVSLLEALLKRNDLTVEERIQALLLQAESLLRLERKEETALVLEKLEKLAPKQQDAELLRARLDFMRDQPKDALIRLDKLLDASPEDPRLYAGVAELETNEGELTHAQKALQSWRRLAPDEPHVLLLLTANLNAQEKGSAALELLQAGVKQFPANLDLQGALAAQYVSMDQPAEAIAALAGQGIDGEAQVERSLLRANLYRALQDPEKERATLERLVRATPQLAEARSALGQFQQRSGELEAAEASLQEALNHAPRDQQIRARLAAVLDKLGRQPAAAKLHAIVADASEGDPMALNNAAVVYVDELSDPQRAVELAEKAHQLTPTNPAVIDTLGWSLVQRGEPEDLERAGKFLREAHSEINSAETGYHYATLLLKQGQQLAGQKLLRQTLSQPGTEPWRDTATGLLR